MGSSLVKRPACNGAVLTKVDEVVVIAVVAVVDVHPPFTATVRAAIAGNVIGRSLYHSHTAIRHACGDSAATRPCGNALAKCLDVDAVDTEVDVFFCSQRSPAPDKNGALRVCLYSFVDRIRMCSHRAVSQVRMGRGLVATTSD